MTTEELLSRLERAEAEVRALQSELLELRALVFSAAAGEAAEPAPRPADDWFQDEEGIWRRRGELRPEPEPVRAAEPERLAGSEPLTEVGEARGRSFWDREVRLPEISAPEFDFADLLGAKALAWAGGILTLLGVVFFFVLAVNRGWVGPGMRVALGAGASLAVFALGLWLRRAYATTYSALSAVGAGLAGGYATLLAATALYGFLPKAAALGVAAAIAALGVAVSLVWESELVAGLGLVGAMVVPAMLVFEGGLTAIGTAFVAVVFAGGAVVGIRERWNAVLVAGALASAPQVVGLVAKTEPGLHWGIVAIAAAFCLLYLGTGVAYHLAEEDGIGALATTFVLGAVGLALFSAGLLLEGSWGRVDRAGVALLVAACVYGGSAAWFFPRERRRDLAAVLLAGALTLTAVGVADLLSGGTVTYTWAAEAAILAWLARRLREARFQLAALAYLVAAFVHAFAFEARLDALFSASSEPGSGAPSGVALALAGLAVALTARDWRGDAVGEQGIFRVLAPMLAELRARQSMLRAFGYAVACVVGIYAASLGLLQLYESTRRAGVQGAFHQGQLAVTGLWCVAALLALAAGLRLGRARVTNGALAWLAVTVVKVVFYDGPELSSRLHSYSFVALAATLLLAGYAFQLLDPRAVRLHPVTIAAVALSVGFFAAGNAPIVNGHYAGIDLQGAATLGLAALYGAFALHAFRRHRAASTLLWAIALVVAAAADFQLVSGNWLVLVLAASAGVLAWLAGAAGEPRFHAAGVVYALLGLGLTLFHVGPPTDLWLASRDPGRGAPAAAFVAGALVVLAALWPPAAATSAPESAYGRVVAWLDGRRETLLTTGYWAAGVLVVYALSLALLELVEQVVPGDVKTDFQRGHTIVSALWGTLGLALLYTGLRRGSRALRLGGFALFGVSVGKVFFYDLPSLSPVARALSFLAVGAVLLLGAFFYQRLSEQPRAH
jgi:uncharacterized membrane protein